MSLLGLHLPEVAIRVEADPVALAPKGSPDPWVSAVLQDAIGEQGFLGECDENGHVARWVAEKRLRKEEPIESTQKALEENHRGTLSGGK